MKHSIVVLILALAGCATTPEPTRPVARETITEAGQARIVVRRNNDSLFLGVPARLAVNGEQVASLWRSETTTVSVPPGKVLLTTDAWSSPGRFTLRMETKPGMEYTLEIGPRGGHYGVLLLLGVAGSAVHSAIEENSGAFSIMPISEKPIKRGGVP